MAYPKELDPVTSDRSFVCDVGYAFIAGKDCAQNFTSYINISNLMLFTVQQKREILLFY